jgi:broad specificity phosphatase PhoE
MTLTEIWLVRHGESVGNEAATRAEREGLDRVPLDIRDADVPLSSTGREQAEALGRWLSVRSSSVDVFWVSPYARARQTLAIALDAAELLASPRTDERLRDRELGILDLLTTSGVARFHPEEAERRLHLGKFYHRPPGGESWADVALRLRSFLSDAAAASPAQQASNAMVVAHDAVVMVLLYLLLGMEEAELLDFAASRTVLNASVTHLTRSEDGWRLVDFAAVDHLTTEGAPVTAHPGSPDVHPE